MAKEERIAVRLDSATKAALVRAAEEDGRSLSSMVERIVADWLCRKMGKHDGREQEVAANVR